MNKNILRSNYIILIFGRLISGLGSSVFSFAFGLYILDITNSAIKFSFIISIYIITGIIVNLFTGVFVDRYNKKWIMVLTDILSGVIALFFLLLFLYMPKKFYIFVLFLIAISFFQSIFVLAINSSIPNLVDNNNIARANSILQIINSIINIIGPVIGALLYKALGLNLILIINGISLIAAGIIEIFLVYNTIDEKTDNINYFNDIKSTYKYLLSNEILIFFFITTVIINFMHLPLLFVVIPYINYNIIKISGLQLAFVQASCAVGIILGALFITFSKVSHKILIKKIFTLSFIQAVLIILWIFPVFPIFQSNNKWYITFGFSIILILFGIANSIQIIPIISYFQKNIPENLRARLFGVFTAALYISTPAGLWLYGFLLEDVKWIYIIITSGLLYIAVSLFACKNKIFLSFLNEQIE